MSEQLPQQEQPQQAVQTENRWTSPCPHPEAAGKRWGDPISEERQEELRVLADQQRAWAATPEQERRESPFRGVRLTGADAFWLAAYALADGAGDVSAQAQRLRAGNNDFLVHTGLSLFHLRLEGADLREAHLERAILYAAHLEGAA
jgi:hypothetical protein